jgi:exodeoxyribonuclease VII large subunit
MNEKLSLTELQLIIRDSLYMSFPDTYWVIAEISEIKENSTGHCYLELIEKHPDEKNVRSRVKAIIWSNRYRFLKALFNNSTGENLREGLKILVKTKIEYHELYGLSLIISDIDPAFTIGDMALKRQLTIKKLEQEGVFSMNKELVFPVVPQKIAVISSKNAAGYSDFLNQLKGNSFGYVFTTVLFETVLQGTETERSVIRSFDKIADYSRLFDLVVIIRGGGSQSDLSWFDSYNIAYHVTQFPLPVVTGIGHDKDVSITDMVANISLKTPTAVADFLINTVVVAENHIYELSSEIVNASHLIIEKNRNRIESSGNRLLPLARVLLSEVKDKLSTRIIEISNIGKELIFRAGMTAANLGSKVFAAANTYSSGKRMVLEGNTRSLISCILNLISTNYIKIKGFENTLQILNPDNVLQRGYSISSINGRILKNSDQIKNNDIIDTRLYKGTFISRVVEKRGRMDEEEKGERQK